MTQNNGGPGQGLSGLRPTTNVAAQRTGFSPLRQLGKYDKGISSAVYEGSLLSPEIEQMYYRGQQQSALKKHVNGLFSAGLSILPKVGAGLGYVGGALWAMGPGKVNDI